MLIQFYRNQLISIAWIAGFNGTNFLTKIELKWLLLDEYTDPDPHYWPCPLSLVLLSTLLLQHKLRITKNCVIAFWSYLKNKSKSKPWSKNYIMVKEGKLKIWTKNVLYKAKTGLSLYWHAPTNPRHTLPSRPLVLFSWISSTHCFTFLSSQTNPLIMTSHL